MGTSQKQMDRRVERTRQLLLQASIAVMQEKGFATMSIHDITDRANVNRGTFYAHFGDKYQLLDVLIREEFYRFLKSHLPPNPQWDRKTLHVLIQTVLEYYSEMRRRCHLPLVNAATFERAIEEELTRLVLSWLQQGNNDRPPLQVPIETIAQVVCWAILGAAVKWSKETTSMSAEQMANDVLLVIMDGVMRLVPNIQ